MFIKESLVFYYWGLVYIDVIVMYFLVVFNVNVQAQVEAMIFNADFQDMYIQFGRLSLQYNTIYLTYSAFC